MLIDWVRLGPMGKYLALRQDACTSLHSVCTSWPQAKYFPVQPFHSANKYILLVSILTSGIFHRFYNVVIFPCCIFQVYVKACWHHTALKFYFLSSTPYASHFALILNLCIMMLLNCFNLESFLSASFVYYPWLYIKLPFLLIIFHVTILHRFSLFYNKMCTKFKMCTKLVWINQNAEIVACNLLVIKPVLHFYMKLILLSTCASTISPQSSDFTII